MVDMSNNYFIEGDSHRYPNRFNLWNRAHRGAYKKGVRAFADGQTARDNPYHDKRGGRYNQVPLGVRGFWNAWKHGWLDAQKQAERS
jgi:hypothetical protein